MPPLGAAEAGEDEDLFGVGGPVVASLEVWEAGVKLGHLLGVAVPPGRLSLPNRLYRRSGWFVAVTR